MLNCDPSYLNMCDGHVLRRSPPINKTHFLSLGTFLTKYFPQVETKHISYLHGLCDHCFDKRHVSIDFYCLLQINVKGLKYRSKVHVAANPQKKKFFHFRGSGPLHRGFCPLTLQSDGGLI